MRGGSDVDWLLSAIGFCSRGAVAYKAAYMLALLPKLERILLDRCTERYALLERLLGVLLERGTTPEQLRDMLDHVHTDPARYSGFSAALAQAMACDRDLRLIIERALDDMLPLPAAFEAYLAAKRQELQAHDGEDMLESAIRGLQRLTGRNLPAAPLFPSVKAASAG
jgi:hypothetical protein